MSEPSLKDQIHEQMTESLRSGDKLRLGTLRMLTSAIRYKEDEVGHELSDEEVREVATKEVKKRTESAVAFRDAGRDELADKEEAEREVVAAFAPISCPKPRSTRWSTKRSRPLARNRCSRWGRSWGRSWAGRRAASTAAWCSRR